MSRHDGNNRDTGDQPNEGTTFYRQALPDAHVEFTKPEGIVLFREALVQGSMNCYFILSQQFVTQVVDSGLSTLVMVLNAFFVDPLRCWRAVWRWYDEAMFECCVPHRVTEKGGLSFGQFIRIAKCNSLDITPIRVESRSNDTAFRDDVTRYTRRDDAAIIVNYSRLAMDQEGEGHYSTIGGYHSGSDRVLILDVERYRYPAHWVPLTTLFQAMQKRDDETGLPRGYILATRNTHPMFSVSHAFQGTHSSHFDNVIDDFFEQWSVFLATPRRITRHVLEYSVSKMLCILSGLSQPVNVFRFRVKSDSSVEPKDKCKCLLKTAVDFVRQTETYKIVQKVISSAERDDTNSRLQEKLDAFGDEINFNNCELCDINQNCALTPNDFLMMFLLCWPYCRSNLSCIGTQMHEVMSATIADIRNDAILNEIKNVRGQLAVGVELCRERDISR